MLFGETGRDWWIMQEFGASTRSEGRAEANPAARTWMKVKGTIAVLDDAARGLVNDTFQRKVLVRQRFKGYVNWFSEVAEHAAWNGLTLRRRDTEHVRIGFQPFSSPRAISLIILSSIRMTPRLPAGDRRIRCVRISPLVSAK